ncbi:hypothetical protein EJ04DRAFT_482870 [Polyplosphaeria fusca]|uniref:C2H2-type domain-containing protein n=1 Tax=Polyplosphaeria fusca TaxID=682080 RepID=A0A9P4RAY3_9PLEO|nr:hypothetical protein EJ04DRAFT_482870 [Polyplosphaeria fusca]
MPAPLEAVRRVKCTYNDCGASFDTEKQMRSHKKNSEEHDYCSKCNQDFDSPEDFNNHKVMRPDMHKKACRVCGDEFKSDGGLRNHINDNHKVNQKIKCPGCHDIFFAAKHLIEHLEYGHCRVISAIQFQGCIIHKHLISKMLTDSAALQRFFQKISKFDAALDTTEGGGVDLFEQDQDEVQDVRMPALQPVEEGKNVSEDLVAWPGVSAQKFDRVTASLRSMSLQSAASPGSRSSSPAAGVAKASTREEKPWNTGRAAVALFPDAKPTPAPSEWGMQQYEQAQEQEHGINILRTRFWDPTAESWNPERFLEPMSREYYCPFICEQHFKIPADLNRHIMNDHRITKMRCPHCLNQFKSCTALVTHCESSKSKCGISRTEDFGVFLDRLTGGFVTVKEKTRPEFVHNPVIKFFNTETNRIEVYQPTTAKYLQYSSTTPADFAPPDESPKTITIGDGGVIGRLTRSGEED